MMADKERCVQMSGTQWYGICVCTASHRLITSAYFTTESLSGVAVVCSRRGKTFVLRELTASVERCMMAHEHIILKSLVFCRLFFNVNFINS